ncbi:hypothetical protein FQA47_004914, partial [Oryzias melastigma]
MCGEFGLLLESVLRRAHQSETQRQSRHECGRQKTSRNLWNVVTVGPSCSSVIDGGMSATRSAGSLCGGWSIRRQTSGNLS